MENIVKSTLAWVFVAFLTSINDATNGFYGGAATSNSTTKSKNCN
jgi:hypothetical protein